MKTSNKIELLSPAKNLECGIEAIKHGADAVYIGAPRFGARAAATNSLEDIQQLVEFAHLYRAKIYVTVNTILKDDELNDTEEMIWQLYHIGVDALIVQDFALLMLNLPPIPLHASTQMDNRTPEQARFLAGLGFEQVVLARELTIDEIADIHRQTPVPLEVFVHGALCVSYSGQCYVSQHCFGRSANRGECAQFCRLAFDMLDADGKTIHKGRHLLSLKDMNQSDNLEALMDAGARSFKIEGRLKDVGYVKNVTAYYRNKIDEILRRRPEYKRASSGKTTLLFKPVAEKSFNRGFTTYFANGRQHDIASIYTPKSLGEYVGTVKEIDRRGRYFSVAGIASFNNGDGLCFIDDNDTLQGFRVNRVEGNRLFPMNMPNGLRQRLKLYRNNDQEFEKKLARESAERKLSVDMSLYETSSGFAISATDEDGVNVTLSFDKEKELARSPQDKQMNTQLSKLGNTPFVLNNLQIDFTDNWFIPSSVLAEWRRLVVDALVQNRYTTYPANVSKTVRNSKTDDTFPLLPEKVKGERHCNYRANVMNEKAREFYSKHGFDKVDWAYERKPSDNAVLMMCRHCIRFMQGWCPKYGTQKSPFREPYYLQSSDGRRFRLEFDCRNCRMNVLEAK